MKKKSYLLLSALAVILLSTGFLAGTVSAASQDCFSDVTTHWAENFICWMYDNGMTSGYPDGTFKPDNAITRAEVAVFMQKLYDLAVAQDTAKLTEAKAYADANMTGSVTINSGPTVWQVSSGGTQRISYLFAYAELFPPVAATGTYNYLASVPVPSNLYGTGMYLDGMRLCYDADNNAGTFISEVRLYQIDGASGTISNSFTDTTNRADALCRTYAIPSPTLFHADDFVVAFVQATFNNSNHNILIRSLNINLHPSPTGETVLKQPGEVVTPLVPFTEEP